jgi:protein-tyrosine phosphatase
MKISETSNIRRIELEGAYNFRDLGGYCTSEGKETKWRTFFRSDNLAKLSRGDLTRIEKLNLHLIVDLRSKEERVSKPNRLPMGNGSRIKNIEISDSSKSHNDLKREIFYGKLGGIDLEEMLLMPISGRLRITMMNWNCFLNYC